MLNAYSVTNRAENVASKWREYRHLFTTSDLYSPAIPYEASGSIITQCFISYSHLSTSLCMRSIVLMYL